VKALFGAGGGAVLATFVAGGWIIGAVLLVAYLVAVVAVCWILVDKDRPQRLATVLKALRPGPTDGPAGQLPPGDGSDTQDPQPPDGLQSTNP
jgi:hypothetical protein